MQLKAKSWSDGYQPFSRIQWIGITVLFLTTGLTTQSPTDLMRRNPPPQPAGPKPAMGWNSFWPLGCGKHVNQDELRKHADLLVGTGLTAAGYSTLIVECGWEDWPDKDGSPTIKQRTFKDGLKPFTDYLNSKGLHLGFGTWAGPQLCRRGRHKKFHGGDPPSDLKRYVGKLVEWGVGYLSHRPCDLASPDRLQHPDQASPLNSRYVQMEDAIRDSKVKLFYATGQWGASPEVKNQPRANSWRISYESRDNWNSFIRTLNALVPNAPNTRPGSFADLGFLQLGKNKQPTLEMITQYAFWAAAKSPLIFSTDLSKLHADFIEFLKNPGPIAINQDELGKSITFKRRYADDKDIWSGPLSDGSTVAVIINWEYDTSKKQINLADMGFSSAHVYDIWHGKDLGAVNSTYNATVGGHGCLFLKLNDTKPAPKPQFKRFPAETADLMGSARLKDVTPKIKAVSLISPNGGGGARWTIPGQMQGDVLVSFDYINAQWAPGDNDYSKLNFKRVVITVNDEKKVIADFPVSGLLWEEVYEGFLVSLPLMPGDNKVLVEGVDEWAPDFVALSVEQKPEQAG
ncbi:hypothetical protein PTTG_11895 [Puccinia triticina 1-1 BBBD Race 1]|uniref:Alpha-galactosidase n=1 Tax=Puccinia triticina (isolate 1-1 / race 1 (BBBD)) TaxID=630390 RepID=A0A180GEJ9_PUCT1|nr:hypothetical protein PTTG_11895 [Puccinia triticina 1-1 BBBD Race 1]